MNTFCTIITSDYAHYAIALYESCRRFTDIPMHVLCIDRRNPIAGKYQLPSNFAIMYLDELKPDATGQDIILKYQSSNDALRWSLKSVWVRYLLTAGGCESVIFIDPDMYFFRDPEFLFSELNQGSILLSPHWRSTDPDEDQVNFELNFRDGIYNGGFLGATVEGIPALNWLEMACLYKCEIDHAQGLFYDQRYFDLLQSRFPGVITIRHKGCNVANWNQVDCKRIQVDDQVLVNGTEPVVFIHFTKSTIRGIRNGSDALLTGHLDEYLSTLRRTEPSYIEPAFEKDQKTNHAKKNIFRRILDKLIPSDK